MDPGAEWDPMWPKGPKPQTLKLPATFEAVVPLLVWSAPSFDAETMPGRLVQKGTKFSVDEVVQCGKFKGKDILFLKPKRAFFKKGWPLDDEDYGQGGWLCDTCFDQGPLYLRKMVKRFRPGIGPPGVFKR